MPRYGRRILWPEEQAEEHRKARRISARWKHRDPGSRFLVYLILAVIGIAVIGNVLRYLGIVDIPG